MQHLTKYPETQGITEHKIMYFSLNTVNKSKNYFLPLISKRSNLLKEIKILLTKNPHWTVSECKSTQGTLFTGLY